VDPEDEARHLEGLEAEDVEQSDGPQMFCRRRTVKRYKQDRHIQMCIIQPPPQQSSDQSLDNDLSTDDDEEDCNTITSISRPVAVYTMQHARREPEEPF
jgi:hypothetical protein